LVPSVRPDVAIVDISMPILNGIDTARELQKSSQRTKTILLTRHDEDQYVTEALRAGVKGYVLKSQVATDLVRAIQEVCRGGIYLSPNISRTVVEALLSRAELPTDPLTSRARQVLQLVGEGKSTKEVAVPDCTVARVSAGIYFMTCSRVTPGFAVSRTRTPVTRFSISCSFACVS
jgi:DNA-binding NarL/FixJ family response regulator